MVRISTLILSVAPWAWTTADAAMISYSTTSLGGDQWQYEYTVSNDGSAVALIEQFTVFFDPALYSSLALVDAPADWDPIVIEPDTLLPADGFYDALALVSGIGTGGSAGTFVVSFFYLGAGTPGPQPFDIVDPISFATIASGTTAVVPLPGALGLLVSGLAGAAALSRRRRSDRSLES